jgi:hypothetical protein
VRGDLALQARVVLRPDGRVGLVSAVAALTAVAALYLPWYAVRAEVTMLGATRTRTLATMPGWQGQPWIWLIGTLALAAATVGLAVAIDRSPRHPRRLVCGCAAGCGTLAAASAVLLPARERFADVGMHELQELAARVPEDVQLTLGVGRDVGIWVAVGAALLLFATGLAMRDT